MLDIKRIDLLNRLEMAFQPIVYNGGESRFGLEALVANIQMLGYSTVEEMLDEVERESFLFPFVVAMVHLVLKKASKIPEAFRKNLFINLDNRIFAHSEILWNFENNITNEFSLKGTAICFEISEQNRFSYAQLKRSQEVWASKGISLALDDFGTGISGLELLYNSEPNFLKIDRFLIANIDSDIKKQIIVKSLLNMCSDLKIQVIAEGVETENEKDFLISLGVDLFQGFYFQRPTTDIKRLIKNWVS